VADDHAVVGEGLKSLINAQPDMEVTGEAGDGRAACEWAEHMRPDVVVLDVSMPGMSGAQAAARLRQGCPEVRVLALTVHEDKGYLRQLLGAGAAGYVLKRAAAEELIRAIRAVAAGGVYLDPALAGQVVGGLVRQPPGKDAQAAGELSEREGEVVRLGNARGEVVVHARLFDGLQPGVIVVESVWPNADFADGMGINVLTSDAPAAPNGGAVFHDTSVSLRAVAAAGRGGADLLAAD